MSENFRVGTEVMDERGRRGVVTDEVRLSGRNKGLVGVQWIGGPYIVSEFPDDLTPVHKDLDKPVAKPRVYTVEGAGHHVFLADTDPDAVIAWARTWCNKGTAPDDTHLVVREWEQPDATTVLSHIVRHVYKGFATD